MATPKLRWENLANSMWEAIDAPDDLTITIEKHERLPFGQITYEMGIEFGSSPGPHMTNTFDSLKEAKAHAQKLASAMSKRLPGGFFEFGLTDGTHWMLAPVDNGKWTIEQIAVIATSPYSIRITDNDEVTE
jgi:hypothetical protein